MARRRKRRLQKLDGFKPRPAEQQRRKAESSAKGPGETFSTCILKLKFHTTRSRPKALTRHDSSTEVDQVPEAEPADMRQVARSWSLCLQQQQLVVKTQTCNLSSLVWAGPYLHQRPESKKGGSYLARSHGEGHKKRFTRSAAGAILGYACVSAVTKTALYTAENQNGEPVRRVKATP